MIFSYLLNMQSHPSWVCGLKLGRRIVAATRTESHPSWVCGLKQKRLLNISCSMPGHTLRGCVE